MALLRLQVSLDICKESANVNWQSDVILFTAPIEPIESITNFFVHDPKPDFTTPKSGSPLPCLVSDRGVRSCLDLILLRLDASIDWNYTIPPSPV